MPLPVFPPCMCCCASGLAVNSMPQVLLQTPPPHLDGGLLYDSHTCPLKACLCCRSVRRICQSSAGC